MPPSPSKLPKKTLRRKKGKEVKLAMYMRALVQNTCNPYTSGLDTGVDEVRLEEAVETPRRTVEL